MVLAASAVTVAVVAVFASHVETASAGLPTGAGMVLNAPIVDVAATPDGKGYWEVGADGGVFAFGDAGFYGSTGSLHLNRPIVGMATTRDGAGYWEVASDGGVFNFGDAGFYGSTGGDDLNQPIVGIQPTPDNGGYWLVAADGGVFAFGDADFYGSATGLPPPAPSSAWLPPRTVGAIGRPRRTGRCSPSVTPCMPVVAPPERRWSGSPPRGPATAWWVPAEGCSTSTAPRTSGRWEADSSTGR